MMFNRTIIILLSLSRLLFSQIFQWEDPVQISNNTEGNCILPSICNDSNGYLYVTFCHNNYSENKHLYFTSFDGEKWKGVDTLYNNPTHNVYRTKLYQLHMEILTEYII